MVSTKQVKGIITKKKNHIKKYIQVIVKIILKEYMK